MSPNIVILLVDYVDDVIPLPLVFICLYHCRHRKQFFDAINVIVDTIKVRTCMLIHAARLFSAAWIKVLSILPFCAN